MNASQLGVQLSIPLYAGGAAVARFEGLGFARQGGGGTEGARRAALSQLSQAASGVINGSAQVDASGRVRAKASRSALEGNMIGLRVGTRES